MFANARSARAPNCHGPRSNRDHAAPRKVRSFHAQPPEAPNVRPGAASRKRNIAAAPVKAPSTRLYRNTSLTRSARQSIRGWPCGRQLSGATSSKSLACALPVARPISVSQSRNAVMLSRGANVSVAGASAVRSVNESPRVPASPLSGLMA